MVICFRNVRRPFSKLLARFSILFLYNARSQNFQEYLSFSPRGITSFATFWVNGDPVSATRGLVVYNSVYSTICFVELAFIFLDFNGNSITRLSLLNNSVCFVNVAILISLR